MQYKQIIKNLFIFNIASCAMLASHAQAYSNVYATGDLVKGELKAVSGLWSEPATDIAINSTQTFNLIHDTGNPVSGSIKYFIADGDNNKYYFSILVDHSREDGSVPVCKVDTENMYLGNEMLDTKIYTVTADKSPVDPDSKILNCLVNVTAEDNIPGMRDPKFKEIQELQGNGDPNLLVNMKINKTRLLTIPTEEGEERFLAVLSDAKYTGSSYNNCSGGVYIFKWDGEEFIYTQQLGNTCSVTDIDWFNTSPLDHKGDTYLLLAQSRDNNNEVNLPISTWRYDPTNAETPFSAVQLPNAPMGIGATVVKTFVDGNDSYVLVGNGGSSKDGYVQYSKFYKWNNTGTAKFDAIGVAFEGDEQSSGLLTKNVRDIKKFTITDGGSSKDYLAVANRHSPGNFDKATVDIYVIHDFTDSAVSMDLVQTITGEGIEGVAAYTRLDISNDEGAEPEELYYLAVANRYSEVNGYRTTLDNRVYYWNKSTKKFVDLGKFLGKNQMDSAGVESKQWVHFNIGGFDYQLLNMTPVSTDINSHANSSRIYAWDRDAVAGDYNFDRVINPKVEGLDENKWHYYLARHYEAFEIDGRNFMAVVANNNESAAKDPNHIANDKVYISEITLHQCEQNCSL